MFNNWITFSSMINMNWKWSIRDCDWMTCIWNCDKNEMISIDNIVLIEFELTRILLLFKTIFRNFLNDDVKFLESDFFWNFLSYCILSSNTLSLIKKISATRARIALFCDCTKFSFESDEKKNKQFYIKHFRNESCNNFFVMRKIWNCFLVVKKIWNCFFNDIICIYENLFVMRKIWNRFFNDIICICEIFFHWQNFEFSIDIERFVEL